MLEHARLHSHTLLFQGVFTKCYLARSYAIVDPNVNQLC